MPGKVYGKDTLMLRFYVGEAEQKGIEYELCITNLHEPHITSSKTGKSWVISWQELIKMAIEAGINEEE